MVLDFTIALKLAETFKDANPMVRFEATLALSKFVGKYIAAFIWWAAAQGRNVMGMGGSTTLGSGEGQRSLQ